MTSTDCTSIIFVMVLTFRQTKMIIFNRLKLHCYTLPKFTSINHNLIPSFIEKTLKVGLTEPFRFDIITSGAEFKVYIIAVQQCNTVVIYCEKLPCGQHSRFANPFFN